MERARSCGEMDATDEQDEQRDGSQQADDEEEVGATLRSHGVGLHENENQMAAVAVAARFAGKKRRHASAKPV